MNVYFFEIKNLSMPPTIVAIFAESAENASLISGRLMHNIEQYEPHYSGAGLALFRQSGKPEQLTDALASATGEGLGGYTLEDGWTSKLCEQQPVVISDVGYILTYRFLARSNR